MQAATYLNFLSEFKKYRYSCLLNSNELKDNLPEQYFNFDWCIALGNEAFDGESMADLELFQKNAIGEWWFGFISYDFKNKIEELKSEKEAFYHALGFSFFKADVLIVSENGEINFIRGKSFVHKAYQQADVNGLSSYASSTSKKKYVSVIEKIRERIKEGYVYELNYCINLFAEVSDLDPISLYLKMNEQSSMPFSAFFNFRNISLMSLSPERFLKKQNDLLLSQPIKGTSRRSSELSLDKELKQSLLNNEKERAENIMIVDLVRNDLARVSKPGTVSVPDLFGVYSFPGVHQMISTVTSLLKDDMQLTDILQATFPMGSMTGAPKVSAMEHIEDFEDFRRGFYSGALGYIDPDGNFDFNVLIRTAIYDSATGGLCYPVGGAITWDSDPELEWEECMLKARPFTSLFSQEEPKSD